MANIQKRGGNSWRFTVATGKQPDGSYGRETTTITVQEKMTPKNLREYIDNEYRKFKQAVEAGTYVAAGKMNLKTFIETEWRPKYAEDSLSPTTFKGYNGHLDSRILPTFGHMQMDQIRTLPIITFLKELEKPGARKQSGKPKKEHPAPAKGLDIGTIQYTYRVLKNVFKRAKEWKAIMENPMDGVSKPKLSKKAQGEKAQKEKKKPQFYDEEEAQTVVYALYKEQLRWRLLILGSMVGGFRRGELVGLEWSSVNIKEQTIAVENTIPLTEKGNPVEKGPKSISSERIVDMPEWYMEELAVYQQEWEQEKEDLGDKWEGGERRYVFHNGTGAPYYYQHPSKWWVRFCKRHGIRYIKFHGLRHSMGTLMLEDEVNVDSILKVIQERLGHSRQSTTADIYLHVTKRAKKLSAEKFNKFDRRKKHEPRPVAHLSVVK